MTPAPWILTIPGKLTSLNAERSAHWASRLASTRQWRIDAAHTARRLKIPPLQRIAVEATPHQARGRLCDCGNHYPSIKAAVDGLVDAHVIPDDDPTHLVRLTQRSPQRSVLRMGRTSVDWLHLTITEEDP
ncbi:MAG: hypothetical protein ACYCU7_18635 [Acidimicrobiales bacterium]